eukprot:1187121-Prorocentrum_minimum.AAC.4
MFIIGRGRVKLGPRDLGPRDMLAVLTHRRLLLLLWWLVLFTIPPGARLDDSSVQAPDVRLRTRNLGQESSVNGVEAPSEEVPSEPSTSEVTAAAPSEKVPAQPGSAADTAAASAEETTPLQPSTSEEDTAEAPFEEAPSQPSTSEGTAAAPPEVVPSQQKGATSASKSAGRCALAEERWKSEWKKRWGMPDGSQWWHVGQQVESYNATDVYAPIHSKHSNHPLCSPICTDLACHTPWSRQLRTPGRLVLEEWRLAHEYVRDPNPAIATAFLCASEPSLAGRASFRSL